MTKWQWSAGSLLYVSAYGPRPGEDGGGARTTVGDPGTIAPSGRLPPRQGMHIRRAQRIAADAPVPAFHFLDHAPRDTAHVLALDRDHRVGQLADHLAFLLLAEHVLDDANLNERHCISPSVPMGLPFERLADRRFRRSLA